jgi:hypothetical protein
VIAVGTIEHCAALISKGLFCVTRVRYSCQLSIFFLYDKIYLSLSFRWLLLSSTRTAVTVGIVNTATVLS